jgi:hypothetical protein
MKIASSAIRIRCMVTSPIRTNRKQRADPERIQWGAPQTIGKSPPQLEGKNRTPKQTNTASHLEPPRRAKTAGMESLELGNRILVIRD